MSSFLDLRASPPSSSSSSASLDDAGALASRPKTSSLTPTPQANEDNDFACRQLPPMSASQTMPAPESPSRLRRRPPSNFAVQPQFHHYHMSQQPLQQPPPQQTSPPPTHSKRLSVFGGRSRSNTATSTSSSYQSPASSMTSMTSSQRSSQDGRGHPGPSVPFEKQHHQHLQPHAHSQQRQQQQQGGNRKSVFNRGSRLLKRQSSRFSISTNHTLVEEDEMGKHTDRSQEKERHDGLGIFHRHRPHRSDMHELVKRTISEPFDFHHITHTNPTQLPPLDTTHPSDLATEFSILRASQRPRADLKGINAESIYYNDVPNEDRLSMLAPDSQSLFTRSPPASPTGPSPRSPTSFFTPKSPPRTSRSVENFSRPVSRQAPSLSPSIIPPPRSSSKFAGSPASAQEPTCQNVEALLGPDHAYPQPEVRSPRSPMELAPAFNTDDAGQAFSSEDNTAKPIRSPLTHTPELADVPEEDESAWRNSVAPPPATSSRTTSPPPKNMNFSFPSGFSRSSSRRPQFNKSLTSPATFLYLPSSQEEVQSPTIPSEEQSHKSGQSPAPEIPENDTRTARQESTDKSWEDDIDYCYEHAAESTSNFDWQRNSFDGDSDTAMPGLATLTLRPTSPVADDDATAANSAEETQKAVPFMAELHPPSTSASGQSSPDLQPISAVSSSSQSNIPGSPGKSDGTGSFKSTIYPPLSSPRSESSDGTFQKPDRPIHVLEAPSFDDAVPSDHDPTAYDDLISDAAAAEAVTAQDSETNAHFPFYAHPPPHHSDDPSRSSRGSGSPISKCNSQESVILSRAASIARKHRSSTSTTSVPELVHSSSCSRETVDRDREREREQYAIATTTVEVPRPFSPRTTVPTPVSATHFRSKTLTSASASPSAEASTAPGTPTHDRTKSASVLDSQDNTATKTFKSAATGRGGATPRKTRTYSLFPSAPSS